VVIGDGPAATELRARIAESKPVHITPLPSTPVPLVVDSDYLLDCLAIEVQHVTRTRLDTEYERADEDAPARLRERLRGARDAAQTDPYGRVY
jgi:hypothetical protein